MLQARFAVIHELPKLWDTQTLWEVMIACVIMHNMIVKHEGDGIRHGLDFQNVDDCIQLREHNLVTFEDFL